MALRIELFEQAQGLLGGREMWIKVLSNQVMDLPTILEHLAPEDRARLNGMKMTQYHPHAPTDEEREEHSYLVEDWFIYTEVH